ncbi:CHAT domain-containing protein [Halotia branconii]|uniref:CHAT domain-containing protein n=1 Tax=Halotia branconii CENA392 TaxID=1539056 RepID=A0AAJ6PCL3_9CYAN|nr:CHAT domain-containing protein [Halotia branconii]WGV29099.1 CHAT domain-containing protein [Halotia branconii CENA392]
MIKWKYCLKYVFLGILSLSIILTQSSLLLAQSAKKETRLQQAELLTQIGKKQLNQGQPAQALDSWQQATKIYHQIKDVEGVSGSLINQNFALQKLGLYSEACKTIVEALSLNDWICDPIPSEPTNDKSSQFTTAIHQLKLTPINLLALQSLGQVLRLIDKLDESKLVLEETLLLSQQTSLENVSDILLLLGNTKQSIYQRSRNEYKWIEEPIFRETIVNLIPQKARESLDIYQFLESKANTPVVKLQAQLNRLNLLLDFDEWLTDKPQLIDTYTKISQQIQPLIKLILQNPSAFSQLSDEQSIQAKLNFANNLSKIQEKLLQSVAVQYATSALETAKNINSERLESESLGTLGKLNSGKSQTYFEKALSLAQSVHAYDIAYEWQQQLADLYQKQGKTEAAIQAYRATIESIAQISDNLLSSNLDTQFFFYEKVEPVYRNYMRLLITQKYPNFERQVIKTNQQLQVAQLEDYLKCGKLDLVALDKIDNLASASAIIHIIDLDDTIQVFAQFPDSSIHYHSADSKVVKNHVNALLNILQNNDLVSNSESLIIPHSQALYKQLIEPFNKSLPSNGTLVFVLDKSFQSLPMGILHNGTDYLFKQYSSSETLGSRVRQPKALSQENLNILTGGISTFAPSFYDPNATQGLQPLPDVEIEIAEVIKQANSSVGLLNKEFNTKRFIQELSKEDFDILHLTTHAQFSSIPRRTGFLTWDQLVNVNQFGTLLKNQAQIHQNAIELLVLSACQTAKGNKMSALGIAGVAAQAGARSIIATLWLVDSKSSVILMDEFYKNIKKGVPKSEALRLAQIALTAIPEYNNPYHWAPYLLVGSWL